MHSCPANNFVRYVSVVAKLSKNVGHLALFGENTLYRIISNIKLALTKEIVEIMKWSIFTVNEESLFYNKGIKTTVFTTGFVLMSSI